MCMGELSAGRQPLAPAAPGNDRTLQELRNPVRRPTHSRAPLSQDLFQALILNNLKSARRGTAGGPSGMTTEHFRPLLDSEEDCGKFWFCQAFAQARSVVRMGRITAGQCPEPSLSRLGQLSRSPQVCDVYSSLGANPLQISCRPGVIKIIARQCSQLTALECLIWCLVKPCFGVCRECREVTGCCHSDAR